MKEEELTRLYKLSQAGDADAYRLLLEGISRIVRPYVFSKLNNRADAEDVVQEILISVHKARHTYDGNRRFLPWLFAIVRHRLADHLRRHYSRAMAETELPEFEEIAAPDVTGKHIVSESIKEAIDELPEKKRQILYLLNVEGYTSKEVAEKLGMKESAVKVAAHRMYKALRKKFS